MYTLPGATSTEKEARPEQKNPDAARRRGSVLLSCGYGILRSGDGAAGKTARRALTRFNLEPLYLPSFCATVIVRGAARNVPTVLPSA
jgi:hypothetical protein